MTVELRRTHTEGTAAAGRPPVAIVHGPVRRGHAIVLEAGRITATAPAGIALVGSNGSGKSSLHLQLAGVLRTPHPASVRIGGRPAVLAWVPQEPVFPAWLGVRDVMRMYGFDPDALIAATTALHLERIAASRADTLSTGERQALAIALALARDADVTLLDEPFAALDFQRRSGAIDLLCERCARGGSFLLSSQSAADLAGLCDHYVVIRDGRYVFSGTTGDLEALTGTGSGGIERRLLQLLT
ncbi:MAG TPA: ATP-binding cassette domain-containing protein [Longimicrobiales bacterium]